MGKRKKKRNISKCCTQPTSYVTFPSNPITTDREKKFNKKGICFFLCIFVQIQVLYINVHVSISISINLVIFFWHYDTAFFINSRREWIESNRMKYCCFCMPDQIYMLDFITLPLHFIQKKIYKLMNLHQRLPIQSGHSNSISKVLIWCSDRQHDAISKICQSNTKKILSIYGVSIKTYAN